jgi:hypothetical protein
LEWSKDNHTKDSKKYLICWFQLLVTRIIVGKKIKGKWPRKMNWPLLTPPFLEVVRNDTTQGWVCPNPLPQCFLYYNYSLLQCTFPFFNMISTWWLHVLDLVWNATPIKSWINPSLLCAIFLANAQHDPLH